MTEAEPSYAELKAELTDLRAVLQTIRAQEADAVIGKKHVLLLRMQNAEASLNQEKKFLQQLYDTIADAIVVEKIPGRKIENVNDSVKRIFGYNRDGLVGKSIGLLYAERGEYIHTAKIIRKAIREQQSLLSFDIAYRHKNGKIFPGEAVVSFIREEGKPVRVIRVIRDISEHKMAEARLKYSLAEKDVLLQELYHRTKNNMNLISSLMSLQSIIVDDEKLVQPFKDMQSRIQAMALVHERLYKSQDLNEIDIEYYIKDLTQSLLASFNGDRKNIELIFDIEKLPAVIDTAIPCGLIINELMTNALKYAFPGGASGQICITLRTLPENRLELIFSDNGRGLPENFDLKDITSLGMKIVEILVLKQLKGEWSVSTENGTKYRMVFNKK